MWYVNSLQLSKPLEQRLLSAFPPCQKFAQIVGSVRCLHIEYHEVPGPKFAMTAPGDDIKEGRVSFTYPGLPDGCETWYRVYGDLNASSTGRPLICLHGGPGACHNYMLPMSHFHEKHGVAMILYDQIGCGNSTRLRDKRLDYDFWKPELFEAELENLTKHLGIMEYDLLGQSWGGMLGANYAIKQPSALKRLVISNSPASMELWVESCNQWRAKLPREVDDTLEKYEKAQDYDNKDYKDAVIFFYKRHMCLKKGEGDQLFPTPVMETFNNLEEDDTVYFTM